MFIEIQKNHHGQPKKTLSPQFQRIWKDGSLLHDGYFWPHRILLLHIIQLQVILSWSTVQSHSMLGHLLNFSLDGFIFMA